MAQVPRALRIIENVQRLSGEVWVNKHQCKRVADRFAAIGVGLNADLVDGSDGMEHPALDELLTVLRKGEVLVEKNLQWAGVKGVLTWTDNREAFKLVHEELDTMKAKFPFEGISGRFETTSGAERSAILGQDAAQDLEEMKELPRLEQRGVKPNAMDLEKVVQVVMEKSGAQPPAEGLPSYLRIDLAAIDIRDPVRKQEILTLQADHTYGWAIVCEGRWLGCEVAVKVFKSEQSSWNHDQLVKEVGALMELQHPHIIPFIGFAQGAERCSVLMEMMPEKDLRHFINQRPGRPFTRAQELDIIIQIARGMLYLHTQGYAHGDLKCSNILVKRYDDYVEVKIGDLRYAQKLARSGGASEPNPVRRPRWSPKEAIANYHGAAPSDQQLKQADVYSFAMTCYEVVTGKYPFDGVNGAALLEQIMADARPELPGDLDPSLRGLIESCWSADADARPVFENICFMLDHIRSSMPAASASRTTRMWNAMRQIPRMQGVLQGWLGGVRERAQAADEETTWAAAEASPGHAPPAALTIPEYLKINHAALKKVRTIGSGSFAKVYEATWLGSTFAVKRFAKVSDAGSISALQQELNFLIQLRHPCIIKLMGFSVDAKQRCLIVMDFMDGSLRHLIDSRAKSRPWSPPFELPEALTILTKLAQGMAFLHSRGVTHRDLKATNVLCQARGGQLDVKIVDFGVSEYITGARVAGSVGVGTGFWRAPEILPTPANRARTAPVNLMAADVYSFAMTCYEALTGLVPFRNSPTAHYDNVVQGLRPTLPPSLHPALARLVEQCWHRDPDQRPDFADICSQLQAISPS